ncbi:hypothetical protein [Maribellus mangrovi]|uniref:hypothetical protein n=1 Tax=Maribellus mangrovi TaxID=3133146 RepID=UPI0030EE7929
MKQIFALLVLTLSISTTYGQDKIVKLSGDTIKCKVKEITDNNIKYIYEGEELLYNISKNAVKEIIFSSSRVQKFSKRVIINGEEDWEKVIITFDKKDIDGLVECCEIVGKSSKGGVASVSGGKSAMKKMQKKAAENGAHIILITDGWHHEKNKPISGYGRGVKLTGTAYKYE